MKKILLIMFCMVLLVGSVSALDFLPIKQYDEDTSTITIKNNLGLGRILAEYTLTDNSDICLVDCYAEGTLYLDDDNQPLFDGIKFKNIKGNTKEINDYKYFLLNKGEWKEYKGEILERGSYNWRIEGKKNPLESVDWIVNTMGKEFVEWAWWNNTWNYRQLATVNYADSVNLSNYWVNVTYFPLAGKFASDMSDLRITNVDDDAEYIWKYSRKNDTSIDLWIRTDDSVGTVESGVFQFYVYYNTTTPVSYGWNNSFYFGDTFTNQSSLDWINGKNPGAFSLSSVTNSANYSGGIGDGSGSIYHDLPTYVSGWENMTIHFNATWSGSCAVNDGSYHSVGITATGADPVDTWIGVILNGRVGEGNNNIANIWAATQGALQTSGVICNDFVVGEIQQVNNSNSSSVTRTQKATWAGTGVTAGSKVDTTSAYQMSTSPALHISSAYRYFGQTTLTSWILISEGNGTQIGYSVVGEEELSGTLNYPENNDIVIGKDIEFNATTDLTGFDNVSLIIDDVYNETNSSGIEGEYIFDRILDYGEYNWTIEICTTTYCVNSSTYSFSNIIFQENNIHYNSQTYETKEETFTINVTTDGASTTSAEFYYNDVSQGASTKTGTDANANFSNTIQILTSTGNKEFYWKITVGAIETDSTKTNQTVNHLQLGICNATLIVPYINFTFVDEETTLNINATIDTSNWEYWLGDGTVTKSLIFSNTTLNENYAFCLSASNDTMHNTRSIQYASPGYPQRKYDASSDLTNATTNQTLYLLSSTDGIYSTIQVVDQNGDKVGGLEVTAERQFAGVWTVIGQETTDDAGLVTFWLNPDYDHKFTFAGDDCTGVTVTVRPTQTQYTQQLQCGVTDEIYVSQIEGIKYARTPATGIIQAGTYNFTYQLVSSKDNIINASFQLVDSSTGNVLNSTWSACTSSGCTIWFMYTFSGGEDVKGRYYFDIGNGSILLEGDARWRCVDIPTAGKAGISTFIRDMKYLIDGWGDDTDTADFNRIVIVFFFMCLAISALNYNFGGDTQNPGAFLIIMTFVILMGSLVGGTTGQGFFYFNNLTDATFINNYILAGFTLIITISYFINVNRQAQR